MTLHVTESIYVFLGFLLRWYHSITCIVNMPPLANNIADSFAYLTMETRRLVINTNHIIE